MSKHEHYSHGVGPIYSVPLIDVLPLNPEKPEGMLQQMPSADDLKRCRQRCERVCAGYEVLLHHWRIQKAERDVLREFVEGIHATRVLAKADEAAGRKA